MKKNLYIAALMFAFSTTNLVDPVNAAEVSRSVVKNEIADSVITNAIISQYMVNKNAKGLNISVTSEKGVVTLIGIVPNDDVKEELETIAKDTNGVRKIISKLVINTPTENNLIITKRIKSNLLSEKTIKSLDIKIEVDDGDVTLTGEVPNDSSKELIESIVKNTNGVKDVYSKLEVNPKLEVK